MNRHTRVVRIVTATVTGISLTLLAAPAHAGDYVVQPGDTVWDLAQRHGVSVDAIASANGLANPSLIRIGARLTIPAQTASTPAPPSNSPPSTSTSTTQHTVKAGDTLWDLAQQHGTTVDALVALNSLANPSLIRIGQRILVPGQATGLVGDTFLGRTYPADVVAAANANKAVLDAMDVPSRDEMQQLVIDTAHAMGVDAALAQAVAYQESGFNQRAVSPANAIGCMQVIPTSGEWASGMVGRDLNLLDAHDNVEAGVAILRHLLERNDLETAIASYYQGERSVRTRGMNDDTVQYVDSVLALVGRFE